MILNKIEWIYNLKLKKHENDNILFYKKNVKRHFYELWVLYLKMTIILFYEKVNCEYLLENNNNIILWESVKWLLLWVLYFMTKSKCTTTLVNYGFSSTIENVTNEHS